MSRFLMVDIGAGTMDILYYDTSAFQHYKAVVKSPVQTVAERAAGLRGDLVVTGGEMGGGPVTEVLRKRAGEAKV
ncbi:MAG: pyruvate formate-lyase activating enzyme, partial [Desulfobacterales bacterium]